MSSKALFAILIFSGGALLLVVLLLRLFRLRGAKDESEGSINHGLGLGLGGSSGDSADGD